VDKHGRCACVARVPQASSLPKHSVIGFSLFKRIARGVLYRGRRRKGAIWHIVAKTSSIRSTERRCVGHRFESRVWMRPARLSARPLRSCKTPSRTCGEEILTKRERSVQFSVWHSRSSRPSPRLFHQIGLAHAPFSESFDQEEKARAKEFFGTGHLRSVRTG